MTLCYLRQHSQMQHIFAMEYYSTFKRKEILTYTTTWINLEGIMLNEINQTQKNKYCMHAQSLQSYLAL